MESAFRQSMIGPSAGLGVFWSNPLVGTITTVALLMLFWPVIVFAWRRLIKLLGGGPMKAQRMPPS
jgi:putative tricarboxylic transport membrane protein